MVKTIRLSRDIDFIHVFLTAEKNVNFDRFLVVFKSGESDLFEFNGDDESLLYINSEK